LAVPWRPQAWRYCLSRLAHQHHRDFFKLQFRFAEYMQIGLFIQS
jgi:hypothetical protein